MGLALALATVAGAQATRPSAALGPNGEPGASQPSAASGRAQAEWAGARAHRAEIVLQPRYRAGATYAWRIHIHSVLRRTQNGEQAGATLDNRATVLLRILSAPATPNPATPVMAEARFSQYQTEVSGFGGFADALRASAATTDRAVLRMQPVELRLPPGAAAQILRLGAPPAPPEARVMLRQLFSTAGLPLGAVRVGDHWRRQEIQKLPQLDASFPLEVRAEFTGWRSAAGPGAPAESRPTNWRAEVTSRSQASVTLPPAAIPGFSAAAAAGLASQARLQIDGQTESSYGPNGILEAARSHTHTWLHIARVGGGLPPGLAARANASAATDVRTDSTGSVERIAPAASERRPSTPEGGGHASQEAHATAGVHPGP